MPAPARSTTSIRKRATRRRSSRALPALWLATRRRRVPLTGRAPRSRAGEQGREVVAQGLALLIQKVIDSEVGEIEHRLHLVGGERRLLAGPLHLDVAPGVGAYHV